MAVSATAAFAQSVATEVVDFAVVQNKVVMDSTLLGKNIFTVLESSSSGNVVVRQSESVKNALNARIAANSERSISGYRIRIFSDNKQNARSASESTMNSFKTMYPGLSAYRTYTNPFFKVTVGDFRTKSEALRLLSKIKMSFPTAFIVEENINYPEANIYFE